MKKRKHDADLSKKTTRNPVAKFAHHFNKAQIFQDKNKYKRHHKHKGQEPFPIM